MIVYGFSSKPIDTSSVLSPPFRGKDHDQAIDLDHDGHERRGDDAGEHHHRPSRPHPRDHVSDGKAHRQRAQGGDRRNLDGEPERAQIELVGKERLVVGVPIVGDSMPRPRSVERLPRRNVSCDAASSTKLTTKDGISK
jgi:hypothetical protein